MNRTAWQFLCSILLLACALACLPSHSAAQAGWTQPTVMPSERGYFGAATGPDGRIYVIGGQSKQNGTERFLPDLDIYDPAKNVWTKGAPLPTPRINAGVVTGPDGLIYVIGGDIGTVRMATVEAYNSVTNTWTTESSLPQAINHLENSVAVGSDGRIYLIGGDTGGSQNGPTGTMLAYDLKAKTWAALNTVAPYSGGGPVGITSGPDGKIYTVFGYNIGYGAANNFFAAYDPTTNTWTKLPDLHNPRSDFLPGGSGIAVVTGLDGLIYAIGGEYYKGICCGYGNASTVAVYDPATSLWSYAASLPRESARLPIVSLSDGRLFALGANDSYNSNVADGSRVDVYHTATSGIFPDHGGLGAVSLVTPTIVQKGVQPGAAVKLVEAGQPDIVGQNTDIVNSTGFAGSTRLRTTFDLTGAAKGKRFVVLTNPDGTIITLPQQFTVEDATQPRLETQVNGRASFRGAEWTTYNVVVQNTGNIDASNGDLRIEFPNFVLWNLTASVPQSIFKGENNTTLHIQLPLIAAGASHTVTIRIRIRDDSIVAHKQFVFMAWVNPAVDIKVVYVGDLLEKRLARAEFANGDIMDCFGETDGLNPVVALSRAQIQSLNGKNSTIQFDILSRPILMMGSDGTSITFNWQADKVIVTAISTDNDTQVSRTFPYSGYGGQGGSASSRCKAISDMFKKACPPVLKVGAFLWLLTVTRGEDPYAGLPKPFTGSLGVLINHYTNDFCDASAEGLLKDCEGVEALIEMLNNSGDPNDIAGATGFDMPQWVSGSQPLPYTIYFGNMLNASAAQVVRATDQLDLPGADLSTLSLGSITIGDQTVTPEAHINPIEGVREFDADVDLQPTKNLLVHVNAKLNLDNGLLTWTFTSIDPLTGLPLAPDDPNGFLDPGEEGSALFTVMPRKNLKTGTVVRNQASIVFDTNPAMLTPIWFNTIDNDKPTSTVTALPSTENNTNFVVSWKGTDVGSGVRDYTIYVSDNGGSWTPWQTSTMDTSAMFTGVGGHTYAFYSQARDNVFNIEATHPTPDTSTRVAAIATDVSSQVKVTRGGFRLNRTTGRFVQTVTLTNTGGTTITGPVSLVLDGLSSNAILFNPSGTTSATTPTGSPYLDAQVGDLAAGASVVATLEFTNSDNKKGITYATRVLAGPGSR